MEFGKDFFPFFQHVQHPPSSQTGDSRTQAILVGFENRQAITFVRLHGGRRTFIIGTNMRVAVNGFPEVPKETHIAKLDSDTLGVDCQLIPFMRKS